MDGCPGTVCPEAKAHTRTAAMAENPLRNCDAFMAGLIFCLMKYTKNHGFISGLPAIYLMAFTAPVSRETAF
jgi:hypothetical protein